MKFEHPLEKYIEGGYIRVAKHPSKPLFIYNYTPKTQAERKWDNVTMACRGLVLDDGQNIIIKPPKKFFNQGEPEVADVSLFTSIITEKLDGYYISIKQDPLYGLIVTSRGSFDNKYIDAVLGLLTDTELNHLRVGYTYFLELLKDFPGDESIIVTKHPIPKVVCWAIKDNNFQELPPESGPFEAVKRLTFPQIGNYLQHEVEGVVLQNPETFEREKVKTAWYLQMHRLISDCTPKRVWEILKEGKKVEDYDFPDEFLPQLKKYQSDLQGQERAFLLQLLPILVKTSELSDKQLGQAKEVPPELKPFLFSIRKAIREPLWKRLKPKNLD